MKKAFIILAHENPGIVASLIKSLLSDGSHVVLHYDRSAPSEDVLRFSSLLLESQGRFTLADPVKVQWGEWSVVRATINAIENLVRSGQSFDYVSLLSGSCAVVKPMRLLDQFLAKHRGSEFIESHDAVNYRWVADGTQLDRWEIFKFFNWKMSPKRFYWSNRIQAGLHIKRTLPLGASPRIGSQWWTLTWPTLLAVLERSRDRSVERFYRRTWIPDEHFFQTLVNHVIPDRSRITNYNLMQYDFDDWGNPRYFYDDNYCELVASNRFFARKISSEAESLRENLESVVKMDTSDFINHLTEANPDDSQLPSSPTSFLCNVPDYIFATSHLLKSIYPAEETRSLALTADRMIVVVGLDSVVLEEARKLLNRQAGLLCHGRLFANSAVELERDSSTPACCSGFTVAERDASQIDFLKSCLRDLQGRLVGFLVNPAEDKAIRHLLYDILLDPNAIIIDLTDSYDGALSPVETALDLLKDIAPETQAPGSGCIIYNYRLMLEARALRDRNTTRASISRMLTNSHAKLIKCKDGETQGSWLDKLRRYLETH